MLLKLKLALTTSMTIIASIFQIAVDQSPFFSGTPRPLLHTPLSRSVVKWIVANAWGRYPCRKPGDSVTSLCRGMAAQACYKPQCFDSQPYCCIDHMILWTFWGGARGKVRALDCLGFWGLGAQDLGLTWLGIENLRLLVHVRPIGPIRSSRTTPKGLLKRSYIK